MVDACLVIIAAAGRIGEGVIGIVYLLELASAFCAFWRIGGDAVGVCFQSGALVGIADLLLACSGGYLKGGIVI